MGARSPLRGFQLLIDEYEQFLDHSTKKYNGSLANNMADKRKRLVYISKAITSHENMVQRVRTRKTYIGLTMSLPKREFIYWWIIQRRFFKGSKATVGRIDHNKGYSFDNIRMETLSDNVLEAADRCNFGSRLTPATKLKIYHKGTHVAYASSIAQACFYCDLSPKTIYNILSGKTKKPKKWSFEKVGT